MEYPSSSSSSTSTTTTAAMPPYSHAIPPSLRPHRHTPVPLILESFPSPPSFIPPSPQPPSSTTSSAQAQYFQYVPPHTSNPPTPLQTSQTPQYITNNTYTSSPRPSLSFDNPPPSLPPATPLPPLPPGPSPISDRDSMIIMATSRSRRSSRVGGGGYGSNRNSMEVVGGGTASQSQSRSGSLSGHGQAATSTGLGTTPLAGNRRTSIASTRSFSSSASLPLTSPHTKSLGLAYAISEEEPGVNEFGQRVSIGDNRLPPGGMRKRNLTLPNPHPQSGGGGADDSISSIDMTTLPPSSPPSSPTLAYLDPPTTAPPKQREGETAQEVHTRCALRGVRARVIKGL